MDYARSLLEELMNPYEQSSRKSFTDDDVCKDYLVDFCPNDLFVNTKADLGPCRKVHDDRLKKDYQESKAKNRYPYEDSFASTLRLLINDLERKMRRAQEKLDAAFPEDALHSKKAEAEEKSVIIDEKIKSLLALAESAGEEGRITEAKIYTNQIELLQSELEKLKNVSYFPSPSNLSRECLPLLMMALNTWKCAPSVALCLFLEMNKSDSRPTLQGKCIPGTRELEMLLRK
ncbi:splicing factor, variant 2 [Entomophthora muscae]|uniref:Splicing factor, variant 2 n=1 Tax=Entomophthora muscae TaxID=34485 RepID=A0ACC2UN82_9FUNG|nr:splicing factor, variant 2 [Entomophthora muscae]